MMTCTFIDDNNVMSNIEKIVHEVNENANMDSVTSVSI